MHFCGMTLFACPLFILQEQQKSQKYQKQLEDIKTQINKSGNKSAVCILHSPDIYSLEMSLHSWPKIYFQTFPSAPHPPPPPPPPLVDTCHRQKHTHGPSKIQTVHYEPSFKGRFFFCSPRCPMYWRFNNNTVINLIMILEKALEFLRTDCNFFFYCFLITDQTSG